jgi:hypothetical protein
LFDTSRVAKIIAEQTSFGEADHGRRRTGENAWYVAGLSHEFRPQGLQGQVMAEKPLVLWRTAAGLSPRSTSGAVAKGCRCHEGG